MRAAQRTVSLVRRRPTGLYRVGGTLMHLRSRPRTGTPITSTCGTGTTSQVHKPPVEISSRVRLDSSCLALKASAFRSPVLTRPRVMSEAPETACGEPGELKCKCI
jgi:hypothetical protein